MKRFEETDPLGPKRQRNLTSRLSPEELRRLVDDLVQVSGMRLRVGSTGPFPTVRDLKALNVAANCDVKFSTVYRLDKILATGGASRASIIALHSLDDSQRKGHLQAIAKGTVQLLVKKVSLSKKGAPNTENFRDIVIGSRLNLLVTSNIAPGFMQTVDWFICHDILDKTLPETFLYMILERADYEVCEHLANYKTPDHALVKSIFAQLLFNLESAQHALEYVHYDLHKGNVMLRTTRRKFLAAANFWTFTRASGDKFWIDSNAVHLQEVVIIDFGRNRMKSPIFTAGGHLTSGEKILYYRGEDIGIGKLFHKQWDMRRFAMAFVVEMMDLTKGKQDFFKKLEIDDPAQYDQLIDVLDAMSGHKEIKLLEDVTPAWWNIRPNTEAEELWKRYYARLHLTEEELSKLAETELPKLTEEQRSTLSAEQYSKLSQQGFSKLLEKYKSGGNTWLIEEIRTAKLALWRLIEHFWCFTEWTFEGLVDDVLDMPYFSDLRDEPKTDQISADAGTYRLLASMSTNSRCDVASCLNPATQACACGQAFYCSATCYQKHWSEHQTSCSYRL